MDQPSLRTTLCLLLVVLTGCVSGLPGLDGGASSDTVCKPPEHSDGGIPRCLISERQPDIKYLNYDSTPHDLSVEIVRNNASVVFSRNVTVQTLSKDEPDQGMGWFKDVIDKPGSYTITATMDNTTTETITRRFGRRWAGSGKGAEWRLSITESGDLKLIHNAHA